MSTTHNVQLEWRRIIAEQSADCMPKDVIRIKRKNLKTLGEMDLSALSGRACHRPVKKARSMHGSHDGISRFG